jgi:hypothetical protein
MHYQNGRPAQNGDSIVHIGNKPFGRLKPTAGVLYNATAGNDTCNGMCAPFGGGNHFCPNLAECVRLDDFMAAQPDGYPIAE